MVKTLKGAKRVSLAMMRKVERLAKAGKWPEARETRGDLWDGNRCAFCTVYHQEHSGQLCSDGSNCPAWTICMGNDHKAAHEVLRDWITPKEGLLRLRRCIEQLEALEV